jgi:lysophospholipase L1-like esterase
MKCAFASSSEKRRLWGRVALLLSALLVIGADASSADKDHQNSAAKAVPRDAKWLKRHEEFVELAKQGDVGVLFLGDSITDFWRYPEGQEVWRHYFRPLKAANFGIASDRTEHVLWRVQNGELKGINPKVVVLMIGTNNMGSNSAEEIAEGVRAIVNEILKQKPESKILMLGIFPRSPKATDPIRQKVKDTNKIIAMLDDGGRHVRYLDIGEKFLEADGSLSPKIMPDGLHPNKGGYQIWAKAIEPTLTEMLK